MDGLAGASARSAGRPPSSSRIRGSRPRLSRTMGATVSIPGPQGGDDRPAKLHLPPAARYSEDIDLVQRVPGPIGPTLSRLRCVLGWIGPARSDTTEHPKVTFRFETENGVRRRVKVEINSHEHFGHVVPRLFAVPDPPVGNSAAVPTYELDEALATKLRAFPTSDARAATCSNCGGPASRPTRTRRGSWRCSAPTRPPPVDR